MTGRLTPRENCFAISAHHSVKEWGLHHHNEAARRWCRKINFPILTSGRDIFAWPDCWEFRGIPLRPQSLGWVLVAPPTLKHMLQSCSDSNRSGDTVDKIPKVSSRGMRFKSRADEISHILRTTRHRCNLDCVGLGAKPRDGYRSLVTPERVIASIIKIWFFLKFSKN